MSEKDSGLKTFGRRKGLGVGDAFHKDLSERGQMEKDAECMIQFTVLFIKMSSSTHLHIW